MGAGVLSAGKLNEILVPILTAASGASGIRGLSKVPFSTSLVQLEKLSFPDISVISIPIACIAAEK